jgi:Leucine-rich repeat (LRR) protein
MLRQTTVMCMILMVSAAGLAQIDGSKVIKFCGQEISANEIKVDCADAQVKDLTPLKGLLKLEILYLRKTQVEDLTPLRGLSDLKQLALYGSLVKDLSPLEGLSKLELLVLGDAQVEDLTSLEDLSRLKMLDLHGTRVKDLSPLRKLSRLTYLDLRNTPVKNLKILTPVPEGQVHSSSAAKDAQAIERNDQSAGLEHLEFLFLSNTPVEDLTPLKDLAQLKVLSLKGVRVSEKQIEALTKALPHLKIDH